jgi:hypothetical protein
MRTFTAALLFALCLCSIPAASHADALSGPGLPSRMARPQPPTDGDDSSGDDSKDGKDDDEEDEEE